MYIEISQKQADFTVFASDPRGARAPFAPPGYAGEIRSSGNMMLIACKYYIKIHCKKCV